jgi:hypothetical protein
LAGVFRVRVFRVERSAVREMSEQLTYADDRMTTKKSAFFSLLPVSFSIGRKGAQ